MSHIKCEISGCGSIASRRGWCNKHYLRWYRNGSPHVVKQEKFESPDALFESRTKQAGECLIWTGATYGDGRGTMRVDGKKMAAYRYAWEKVHGPIPDNMSIDHKCFTPSCVNVDHLRLATTSENNSHLSGPRKNNHSTGIRNVTKDGKKYRVVIGKDGQRFNFGSFDSLEEAADVAEHGRQSLFGAFAGLGLHSDTTARDAIRNIERQAV